MSEPAAPKIFSLKKAETHLLIFTKQHQDAIFSGLLSTIAADRLAYPVGERTQFKLLDDMTRVEIGEMPAVPGEPSESIPSGGGAIKSAE